MALSAITAFISPCVIRYCKSLVLSISEHGMIATPNFKAAIYNSYVAIDQWHHNEYFIAFR